MAESTLATFKDDLDARIGSWLGYGRGSQYGDAAWTPHQQANIDECRVSGLHQVYVPPIASPSGPYAWSFMRPTASFTLVQGTRTIDLPDDFGSFEGDLTVTSDPARNCPAIRLTGEANIRQMYVQSPTQTGYPRACAEQPIKGTSVNKGQRSQLYVFPEADQDYTITGTYNVIPGDLSNDHPYPYGGAQMAELIRLSCRAKAEQNLDDAAGVQTQAFMQALNAAIAADRKNKPAFIGYNGDRSDWGDFREQAFQPGRITYNGYYPG